MVKSLLFQDLEVPVPGYGAMGLSFGFGYKATQEEGDAILGKALDMGCTFWDTAVVYAAGANETLIGNFFKKSGARDKVFIATKCGIKVDFETGANLGSDGSPDLVREHVEGSIQRLGTNPDMVYIHRIDPKIPIEETVGALDELRKAGKFKYVGLSECSSATLRRANKVTKINAIQAEYSLFENSHEAPGGLLETCKELGVSFIAFSPLGRGFLTGQLKSPDDFAPDDFRRTLPRFQGENFYKNLKIVDAVQELAAQKGCSPGQLALAWVIAQGAIPIPGTKDEGRLTDNFGSRDVELSADDLKSLRKLVDENQPEGVRYSAAGMAAIGH